MSANYVTAEFIKVIASALGEFNEKAIFVGGSVIPFYLPIAMQSATRVTEDIDVVVEVIGRAKKIEFEDTLRKKGFKNDTAKGAHTNRWKYKDIAVDIMGTEEKTFGFTNPWYAEAIENPWEKYLGKQKIKILTLPYFIATKMVAFNDRGKGDYSVSHDMEDIVAVLDMSEMNLLEDLVPDLTKQVSEFLKKELNGYLKNGKFQDALPGHISDRGNVEARVQAVKQRVKNIVNLL